MKATDEKCCVCGQPAVVRSFDCTGWCRSHLTDWTQFRLSRRPDYLSLDATFQAWLEQARAAPALAKLEIDDD